MINNEDVKEDINDNSYLNVFMIWKKNKRNYLCIKYEFKKI